MLSRRQTESVVSRRVACIAATAAIALGAAACGSSSHSSSSGTTSSASGSSASGSVGGGSTSDVSAAAKVVSKWELPPTSIGITTPLASAPPTGKTFVYLQCEESQCADIANGVKAAVAAIHWNLKVIPFDATNPATLVAAMQEALHDNPVAVSFSGLPEVTWQSEIPAYQQAGVVLIPQYIGPATTSATVPVNIGGPVDIDRDATILANWVTADSGGQAKTLVSFSPEFAILASFAQGFKSQLSLACPGCSDVELPSTIAQVDSNAVVPSIVSALQKDPSIKYVVLAASAFTPGLPAALSAAGINGVKILGTGSGSSDQQDIREGTETAFTGVQTHISGWIAVDVALRHLEGMTFPAGDSQLPQQLLVKSTVGSLDGPFDRPSHYAQQFEHLWHVG